MPSHNRRTKYIVHTIERLYPMLTPGEWGALAVAAAARARLAIPDLEDLRHRLDAHQALENRRASILPQYGDTR
jgi:hypothetical protein